MPIDPAVHALIQAMDASFPKLHEMPSGTEARRRIVEAMHDVEPDREPLHHVEDRQIAVDGGEITVRIYRPSDAPDLPIVVFFHGGGWVLCDLESHDAMARRMANTSGCIVVATDYRLAPEHRYPTAADDCYAALRWAQDNAATFGGDPTRLAIFGDSAGGNLAAVVAQMARDKGAPHLRLQILAYPVIDARCDSTSHRTIGRDYMLWTEEVQWCWQQYLSAPADGEQPYASPVRATTLAGLAPALVITPEFDPLRDEGEHYAQALEAAGVPTQHTRYDGMFHSFLTFTNLLPAADRAHEEIAAALQKAFGMKS
ncbi:MAG: alpha/beta hydrolase [Acidimicrobiales bacterium]